ncbi:MAG: hypothetical protein AB1782_18225 [Cyanobacteriota bacterium]
MGRHIISILLLICLIGAGISYAITGQSISGEISITEYTTDNKKKGTEKVSFIICDDNARVDASEIVYYLINLIDEKTHVVNTKREKVTVTYASNIIEHTLPPLVILKSRANLKKYLTSTNAKLVDTFQEGLSQYELWQFSIGPIYYKVKIKLPEYFPEQVEILTNKKKTIVSILNKEYNPKANVAPETFVIPKNFKVVDLISK